MTCSAWCSTCSRARTPTALHSMYEELGAYGTSASIIVDDFDSVIHHHTLTAGEYAIASDYRGKVQTLYREFDLTAAQMVGEFGRDKVSPAVRTLFRPRQPRRLGAGDPRDRAAQRPRRHQARRAKHGVEVGLFRAWVRGGPLLVRVRLRAVPALVPRWAASGGDIYGNSPGMEALGDIRQLQHEQLRKAQGIDYMTKPRCKRPRR